jgi:serine/threonine protein kinase
MKDEDFLNEAVKRGFIKEDQKAGVQKTQQDIAAKGLNIDLAQIMIMKGLITTAQADSIRSGDKPKAMQFGPYEIISKLGEGGMGIVYKAVHQDRRDKPLALKILNQRSLGDQEMNARFKREADILVKMKHPNIMEGYEHGEINGRLYIAMEFLQGKIVSSWIKERGKLEEKAVLKIALDIAHALEFVQSQGLVHRDIKPDNIMILESGAAKLMDLGLAKSAGQEVSPLTAPGMAIGTPIYMSLEHIQGDRELDIRTDIYGLGSTLWHAVTGVKPFDGNNPFEIMKQKIDQPVPDPRNARKDVSANMAMLLMTMMAKDRKDRHETPQELIADIRKVLQGEAPNRKPSNAPRRPTVVTPPGAVPRPVPVQAQPVPPSKPPSRRTQLLQTNKSSSSWVTVLLVIIVLGLAAVVGYLLLQKKGVKLFGSVPGIRWSVSSLPENSSEGRYGDVLLSYNKPIS